MTQQGVGTVLDFNGLDLLMISNQITCKCEESEMSIDGGNDP